MDKEQKFTRRDRIKDLEHRAQLLWNRQLFHKATPNHKPKFFTTFPYPYMNGALHLGHGFSLTKNDFYARFKKLKGFNILYPFGFHCTGMPICAAAEKLKYQLDKFGNPPQFPQQQKKKYELQKKEFQYIILTKMGIEHSQIVKFIDPVYWTEYFPPLAKIALKKLGIHTDFDRSFITTSINPYYDSFIRWHFSKLKQSGKIMFGKRPSIFSIKQNQICADHERAQGQGVNAQQLTLIKLQVLQFKNKLSQLEGKKVFMVAATLRPQTMYGQTNIYILPEGNYGSYQMKDGSIYICSQRSIKGMAYQYLTKKQFEFESICDFKGVDLLGVPLKAPLTKFQKIYSLPMMTISMSKGTGIVTSVPSDSPDDFAALTDLKNKQNLRDKFGITKQMVDYQPIPIIKIPNYEDGLIAAAVCKQLNIKSQNDKKQLEQAKQKCYQKGFYEGVMMIGQFQNMKVQQAKTSVKNKLIQMNLAQTYYQPQKKVIARSGQQCIVALCDQWYINYKDQEWKKEILQFAKNTLYCNSEVLRKEFIVTIKWLNQWGFSRKFGLGTKLYWDQEYIIQSLSDSTIYFSYYTICHYLQGDMEGKTPGLLGIKPQDINNKVWDYIFLKGQYPEGSISQHKLKAMRQQFQYWYPMDLRCSGKDLVKNHLTMSLFNHSCVWKDDPKKWPQGFYCNGWVNVNTQKMSKLRGNFRTIQDVIDMNGADATRLALAQAGDTLDDANFTDQNANASILQLSTFEMWLSKQVFPKYHGYRQKSVNPNIQFFDRIFENEIKDLFIKTQKVYNEIRFRDVVKFGWHQFQHIKQDYLINCGVQGPKKELIKKFIYYQLQILYPICPHFSQINYIDYFLPLVNDKEYPKYISMSQFIVSDQKIQYQFIRAHSCIKTFLKNMRQTMDKATKKSKPKKNKELKNNQQKEIKKEVQYQNAVIIIAKEFLDWQKMTLQVLKHCKYNQNWQIQQNWRQHINKIVLDKQLPKQTKTKMFMFGDYILKQEIKTMGDSIFDLSMPYDQKDIMQKCFHQIINQTNVKQISIISYEQALEKQTKVWKDATASVTPGKPQIIFY